MKIVVAVDSFKGSMTSVEAGLAVKNGIERVYSNANVNIIPIADGGEGTVDALVSSLNGKLKHVVVTNPLGEKISASYGIVKGNTAVIEMSAAAGITLIPTNKLNPMKTTTYGVGEMIKDAILSGCNNFIIGIGGSATNDGGVGMLQALGFEFLDALENQVPFGAEGLSKIVKIKDENALPELKNCTFNIACDVTNPLCGENGCSKIFAPQKGARKEDIELMDGYLSSYADLTKQKYPTSDKNLPGTGAAGGMGFAFSSYLNGKLTSGIKLILDTIDFESVVKGADLVITGEGRMDSQTAMGKTPIGIANLAKKHGATVIAFTGSATYDSNVLNKLGIDAIFPIVRGASSLEDAMNTKNAMKNMEATVEQVMSLIKTLKN